MSDTSHNTNFGDTLTTFGLINCTYIVLVDDSVMYETDDFSDALRELQMWTDVYYTNQETPKSKVTLDIVLG